jgi:hypothetical protein
MALGRVRSALAAAAALLLAVAFGLIFHDRYWRHRDCFNELGRCWSAADQEVFVEGAGLIWGAPAGLLAGLALFMLWRAVRPR